MTELKTNRQSKPRAVPILIAFWTAIILLVFILGPAYREASGSMRIVLILLLLGGIWSTVGTALLQAMAVRVTLFILIGYPLSVVAKALFTGYFSLWVLGFLSVIVLINGLSAWYLFRPGVRPVWSCSSPGSGG